MTFIGLLLIISLGYVHSWTLNYAPAKQVSSPHFSRGRQGYAITCESHRRLYSHFQLFVSSHQQA